MGMVHIFSDSCSDLGNELQGQHAINIVPLTVIVKSDTYLDGSDIDGDRLFELVEKQGELPKTSAPSVADFINYFQSVEGEIFFTGISSRLSATVQNATLAARELPDRRIRVVDSLNLSSGIGLLALAAADMRDEGLTVDEIAQEVRQAVKRVHTSFAIDRLDYLYLGGRCSAMENVVGSLLKIHPVIEVRNDGTLGVREKVRGQRHKSLDVMLEDFSEHLDQINMKRVFITHTGCDEDAAYLKQSLLEMAPIEDVFITRAGSTVSSHCGPGTIGILYMMEKD